MTVAIGHLSCTPLYLGFVYSILVITAIFRSGHQNLIPRGGGFIWCDLASMAIVLRGHQVLRVSLGWGDGGVWRLGRPVSRIAYLLDAQSLKV